MYEPYAQGMLDLFDKYSLQLRQITRFHCVLASRNNWTVVDAARLQSGVRGVFSGAVQSYDRLQEGLVRERSCIAAETANLRNFPNVARISGSAVAGATPKPD